MSSLIDIAPEDPYDLFRAWYSEAGKELPESATALEKLAFKVKFGIRKGVSKVYPPISMHQPNAMILSTVFEGQPHSRVLLLKGMSDAGLYFYTNYQSQKAKDLALNPKAAILFHWGQPERQVRLLGEIEKVEYVRSQEYWDSRPRGSQVAGTASPQSQVVPNRDWLKEEFLRVENQFKDQPIPCPDYWGGYLFRPHQIEFWQAQAHRFHDRVQYIKAEEKWSKVLLAP